MLIRLTRQNPCIPLDESSRYMDWCRTQGLKGFCHKRIYLASGLQLVFLLSDAKKEQQQAAEMFVQILKGSRLKELYALSELRSAAQTDWSVPVYVTGAKSWSSWKEALANARCSRNDFPHLTDEQYAAMLVMGTFNGNGFYRQSCLRALAESTATIRSDIYDAELPLLLFAAFRLNDWAEPIRTDSELIILSELDRCSAEAAFFVMPMAENIIKWHARGAERFKITAKGISEKLLQTVSESNLSTLLRFEDPIRSELYRSICGSGSFIMPEAALRYLLSRERTGYGKTLLFGELLRRGAFSDEELSSLESSGVSDIRYAVLNKKYDNIKGPWPGVEELLADPSAKVRNLGIYVMKTAAETEDPDTSGHAQWPNVNEALQNLLDKSMEELKAAPAGDLRNIEKKRLKNILASIGETRDEYWLPTLDSLIDGEDESLAVAAFSAWTDITRKNGEDRCWTALAEGSEAFVNASYKAVKKFGIRFDCRMLYEEYLKKKDSPVGRKLLLLLLNAPSWNRLIYLLLLLDSQSTDRELQSRILFCCRHLSPYCTLPQKQREELRAVLNERASLLPADIVRNVLFGIGN